MPDPKGGGVTRAVAIAAAAAVLAGVAGCSADHGKKADDYSYVDLGRPAPEPKPGTRLSFGDPAWIDAHAPEADWADGARGAKDLTGPIGVTVLDMYPLDKSYWNRSLTGDFRGRTPVVVVSEFDYRQTRVTATGGDRPDAPTPPLLAALPNGRPVPFVDNMVYNAVTYEPGNCVGRKVPAFNQTPGNVRYIACEIFAPKDGQMPTEVIYDGIGTQQVFARHSPYTTHPIVWTPKG